MNKSRFARNHLSFHHQQADTLSIQSNGGQVVPLEKQADIMIVDHMRKDVAPGT